MLKVSFPNLRSASKHLFLLFHNLYLLDHLALLLVYAPVLTTVLSRAVFGLPAVTADNHGVFVADLTEVELLDHVCLLL